MPTIQHVFQNTRRRDRLVAGALFLATAIFVVWQNSRIAVLWDLSYLLDTSWRIALGQMPYRDFPLVHPPLTFLIQAALMRIMGRHYFVVILYAAVAGGFGTVLAWRIILRILRDRVSMESMAWPVSLLFAAPLCVVGIYSIYPHPIYDCDCALAVLLSIFLLQRSLSGESSGWIGAAVAGTTAVLPVFFKQNIGVPFLIVVIAGLLALLGTSLWAKDNTALPQRSFLLKLLASVFGALAVGLTLIQISAGLGNYLHWTVQFATQRRLPGVGDMLAVYVQPSFVWMLPCLGCGPVLLSTRLSRHRQSWITGVWITGTLLAAAPFVASLIYLFFQYDADERADNLLALWPLLLLAAGAVAFIELRKGVTVRSLTPFWVLAAIHGTFLSQQLWGSTYAIWPLLMILVACMLASFSSPSSRAVRMFAVVIGATFLVCGGLYAVSLERLKYIQAPDGELLRRASLPALRGMATRGPFLADFEELIQFAEREIPLNDGILLLPGEEPFYFATGRVPQFPVQIFDRTTDPYSADELMAEARRRGIRWVVVKTRLQSNADPLPERAATLALLAREFVLYRRLAGYDVYLRR
jgi:hypothetical protein